jgi:hypothetical protein
LVLLFWFHIIDREDPYLPCICVLSFPPALVTGIQHQDLLSFAERKLVICLNLVVEQSHHNLLWNFIRSRRRRGRWSRGWRSSWWDEWRRRRSSGWGLCLWLPTVHSEENREVIRHKKCQDWKVVTHTLEVVAGATGEGGLLVEVVSLKALEGREEGGGGAAVGERRAGADGAGGGALFGVLVLAFVRTGGGGGDGRVWDEKGMVLELDFSFSSSWMISFALCLFEWKTRGSERGN